MLSRLLSKWITTPIIVILLVGTVMPMMPVTAQVDSPAMLILPVNGAQFLPGAYFDFRVEVRADQLPDDFFISLNDINANEFFGAEPITETWTLGDEATPEPVTSVIWRNVSLPKSGAYRVAVTAAANTQTVTWQVRAPIAGSAQNVILFIADGATVPLFTATRLVSRGQTNGTYNDRLSFEKFETIGLLSTSGLDSIITDSANSASTYNTGHKTVTNATGVYPDSSPDTLDDPRVETFAELVKRTRGMAVGIVTTADWSDATPAAVFGHGRDRSATNRSAYAALPLDGGFLPEVILGGGAGYMLPNTADGSNRTDDRDLFTEYENAGYTIATTQSELQAALDAEVPLMLGVFHSSDMNVWLDRNVYTDNISRFPEQPGLVDMTLAALDVLANNPNGFYLEVEAASTDKQLHALDFERSIADTIEFERAIAAAAEWVAANAPDTLIVVTSDHSHGFDVYGTVDVEAFNAATNDIERRNAIGLYNNAGFPDYQDADGDFYPDSWDIRRTLAFSVNNSPDFTENYQVSDVPRAPAVSGEDGLIVDNPEDDPNGITRLGNLPLNTNAGVHTLQDVPVYANGPGSSYFGRSMENIEVFFGMAAAIGLDPTTDTGKMATVHESDVQSPRSKSSYAVGSIADVPDNWLMLGLMILAFLTGYAVKSRGEASKE